MAAQASRAERLAAADDVVDNSGSLDAQLRAQVTGPASAATWPSRRDAWGPVI
jgi:hypothetical protein